MLKINIFVDNQNDFFVVNKCYVSEHKYINIFQVMPIMRELLTKKLKKGTNGIYWLMEQFYTHDDDYKLISSKPFATL